MVVVIFSISIDFPRCTVYILEQGYKIWTHGLFHDYRVSFCCACHAAVSSAVLLTTWVWI